MILRRFLRPKWQHPQAAVRVRAAQRLALNDPVLLRLAREDVDAGVRQAAVARIDNLSVLEQVVVREAETSVRSCAFERLRQLVAGHLGGAPSLAERLSLLERITDSELPVYLVQHGRESQLRKAAVAKLTDVQLLAQVSASDPDVDVRLTALQHIDDTEVLERIGREAKRGDKRISRLAKGRAASLREQRRCRQRLEAICEDLQALLEQGDWVRAAARAQKLTNEWQQISVHADAHLAARFDGLGRQLRARARDMAANRSARQSVLGSLDGLARRLHDLAELEPAVADEIDESIERLQATWRQMVALPEPEQHRLQQQFLRRLEQIRQRRDGLRENQGRAASMRSLLDEAERRLAQATVVGPREPAELEARWRSLPVPESVALAEELQRVFDSRLARLRQRAGRASQEAEELIEGIDALLGELERALSQGELQRAISLRDQARHRLSLLAAAASPRLEAARNRWRACHDRIEELRGWRRWGTDHVRNGLCEEAESLVGGDHDPLVVAQRIHDLRAVWRKLDQNMGSSPEPLWVRFNEACNRAYEPCRIHFEHERAQRERNLEERKALCERLERLVAETDWSQPDWSAIDRRARSLRERWHRLGPVPRAEQRDLQGRYAAARGALEGYLDRKRREEVERREALIGRLERLAGAGDLRTAAEEAKRAQGQWRPLVLSSRRVEQSLWRRFRTVCDGVFERRAELYHAFQQERLENRRRKEAFCEALERLAEEALEGRLDEGAVAELRRRWDETGVVPREVQGSLEGRFRSLLERLTAARQDARRAERDRYWRALRARVRLCSEAEALLEASSASELELRLPEVRRQWQGLPCVADEHQATVLEERFNRVLDVSTGDGVERTNLRRRLEANVEAKRRLCLQLEVLAGVDSPEECARERMALQVSRLSNAFGAEAEQHAGAEDHDLHGLELQWLQLGALPAAENSNLEARIERAWKRLLAR